MGNRLDVGRAREEDQALPVSQVRDGIVWSQAVVLEMVGGA